MRDTIQPTQPGMGSERAVSVEAATIAGWGQTEEDKLVKSHQLGECLWGSGTQISQVVLLSPKSPDEARPVSTKCTWPSLLLREGLSLPGDTDGNQSRQDETNASSCSHLPPPGALWAGPVWKPPGEREARCPEAQTQYHRAEHREVNLEPRDSHLFRHFFIAPAVKGLTLWRFGAQERVSPCPHTWHCVGALVCAQSCVFSL